MKVTLITGASSGIGKTFAEYLASEKHNLVLVARSEEKLKVLCLQLNLKYRISAKDIVADLTKVDSHQLIADEINKRNLDIVI